ncbi:MAG: urease accessory UreF family protein [Pseudomonadota bacterium]
MATNVAVNPALWLLISPALPVGGYSYSQGLEFAVEAGWLTSTTDVDDWLFGVAGATLVHQDLACLARLHDAVANGDADATLRWNRALSASRETAELLDEDRQMGLALARLLRDVMPEATELLPAAPTFATAFAAACVANSIDMDAALAAYAWVWHENQVAAAIKLVPLGQTDGQRLMLAAGERLAHLVECARAVDDDDIGLTLPAVAIASAQHERQHTRLFRS